MNLPETIGLCPVHHEEHWVPHTGICPMPGCHEHLVAYERVHPPEEWQRAALAPRADLPEGEAKAPVVPGEEHLG